MNVRVARSSRDQSTEHLPSGGSHSLQQLIMYCWATGWAAYYVIAVVLRNDGSIVCNDCGATEVSHIFTLTQSL